MVKLAEIKPGQYYQTLNWVTCLCDDLKYQLRPNKLIMISKADLLPLLDGKAYVRVDGLYCEPHSQIGKVVQLLEMSEKGWNERFELVENASSLS